MPTKMTAAYALFEDLEHSAYTFFVTSENDNGTAHQTPARLDVPSADKSKATARFLMRFLYSTKLGLVRLTQIFQIP